MAAHAYAHTRARAHTLVNSATFVNSVAVITRQTLRLRRTAGPRPFFIWRTGKREKREKEGGRRKEKEAQAARIIRDRGFSARKPDARRWFVLVVRSRLALLS